MAQYKTDFEKWSKNDFNDVLLKYLDEKCSNYWKIIIYKSNRKKNGARDWSTECKYFGQQGFTNNFGFHGFEREILTKIK